MILRFGVFELDDAQGELRRAGVRIRVQEQPLRILRELLERRGTIVTREELRAKIWGETFVDYDRALNTAVKKLRDALSDSAEAPRYVETIPRHGYRFIAPVEELTPQSAPALVARKKRAPRFALPIAIVLVLAFVAWTLRPKPLDSLAVLPFVNLTGAAANEYIADGMTDTLISDLANLRSICIISRTSSMQYKNAKKPLRRIASELRVKGIVEGSVLQFGDRVRLEVKLIDARTDGLLWSEQFERRASELDALQHEVATAVAMQLRARIEDDGERAPNAEAHLLTMKGRYWLNEKRDGRVAKELFRQAIAKDPTYAAPHAALAEAEMFAPEEEVSPRESYARAKDAAAKAIALDPKLADAHAAMGLVQMFADHDFAAAERSYRRALELRPGSADIHHRYGQLLAAQGRVDESLKEAKRATELDPFSTLAIDDYGRALYFARRYDDALAQYERALQIEPQDSIARWFGVYALLASGRNDAAMNLIATLLEDSGHGQHVPAIRALYAKQGMRAIAKQWADLDVQRFRDRPFVRSTGIAARYALAGENELAFEWLERAKRDQTRDLVFLKVEPQFDALRSDPRFATSFSVR